MTTFINTYSFMDLLKDKNYVPETDNNEKTILEDIEDAFGSLAKYVRTNTEDYNFMDLLLDHGYLPANDNQVLRASNDNLSVVQAVS